MSSSSLGGESEANSQPRIYGVNGLVDENSISSFNDSFNDIYDFDSFRMCKDTIAEEKLEKELEQATVAIERRMSGINAEWEDDVVELMKNDLQDDRERLIVLLLKKICSFRDPSNRLFISCCYWFFNKKILTSVTTFKDSSEPKLPRVISNFDEKDRLLWCLNISTYTRDFIEEEPLGSGGFGSVFKARHKVDGRCYAVKKIMFRCRHFLTRFADTLLREVQVLSRVTSSNIARYYGAFIEQCSKEDARRICDERHLNQTTWTASETSENRPTAHSTMHNFFKYTPSPSGKVEDLSALQPIPVERQISHTPVNIFPDSWKYNHLQLFLLMEFCGYHTLRDYITDKNRLTNLEEIMPILVQCLFALEALHLLQIVHRDVKPSNIFLKPPENVNVKHSEPYFTGTLCSAITESKRMRSILPEKRGLPPISSCVVKLGDFGLSKFCDSHSINTFDNNSQKPLVFDERQTKSLTTNVGTRFYAAPEMISGSDYDVKVDIYSLGIIFFELLNPPFKTMHERSLALSHFRGKEIPGEIREKFGEDINTLLERMVDRNATTRASVTELLSMEVVRRYVTNSRDSKQQSSTDRNSCVDVQEVEARKQYELLSKEELIELAISRDKALAEQRRMLKTSGCVNNGFKKKSFTPSSDKIS